MAYCKPTILVLRGVFVRVDLALVSGRAELNKKEGVLMRVDCGVF